VASLIPQEKIRRYRNLVAQYHTRWRRRRLTFTTVGETFFAPNMALYVAIAWQRAEMPPDPDPEWRYFPLEQLLENEAHANKRLREFQDERGLPHR
jgi:hypothetical protein